MREALQQSVLIVSAVLLSQVAPPQNIVVVVVHNMDDCIFLKEPELKKEMWSKLYRVYE